MALECDKTLDETLVALLKSGEESDSDFTVEKVVCRESSNRHIISLINFSFNI